MRPNVKNTLFRKDEVTETIGMRIDTGSLAHLMTVLTDLYSDPIMAIVREISTNARDSHIDAGVERPIEVSLPTEGHRRFVVRDFGVGLSLDDIRNVFSAYGASTKRESDDVTGMLGLGCKAPLSYTNSFTVEANKDGVKTIVNVTKDESNVGSIKVLETVPTKDGNGVTVTVPVKPYDADKFRQKATHLFSFWRGGVLVDGVEPEKLDDTTHFYIDPDVALARYNRIIVMGGVPYEVPAGYGDRNGWTVWVDMGEVDFTPSREALHMTKRTEETIKVIESFIATRYAQVVRDELAATPNDWERIKKYRQIQQSGFRSLQGLANFRDFSLPADTKAWNVRIEGNGDASSWIAHGVSVYNLIDMVNRNTNILTDFPFKRVSPLHKAMLAKLNPGKRQEWLVLPEGMSLLGYQDMPHTKWEDVPEIPKKQRPTVVRSSPSAPKYDWYKRGGTFRINATFDDVVDANDTYLATDNYSAAVGYSAIIPGLVVAHMRCDRLDKFKRLYTDAVDFPALNKVLAKKGKALVAKLGEAEILRMSLDIEQRRALEKLNGKLHDPLMKKFDAALRASDKKIQDVVIFKNSLPAGVVLDLPATPGSAKTHPDWEELLKRYPLLFKTMTSHYGRYIGVEDADLVQYANDRYYLYYAPEDKRYTRKS